MPSSILRSFACIILSNLFRFRFMKGGKWCWCIFGFFLSSLTWFWGLCVCLLTLSLLGKINWTWGPRRILQIWGLALDRTALIIWYEVFWTVFSPDTKPSNLADLRLLPTHSHAMTFQYYSHSVPHPHPTYPEHRWEHSTPHQTLPTQQVHRSQTFQVILPLRRSRKWFVQDFPCSGFQWWLRFIRSMQGWNDRLGRCWRRFRGWGSRWWRRGWGILGWSSMGPVWLAVSGWSTGGRGSWSAFWWSWAGIWPRMSPYTAFYPSANRSWPPRAQNTPWKVWQTCFSTESYVPCPPIFQYCHWPSPTQHTDSPATRHHTSDPLPMPFQSQPDSTSTSS